MKRLLHGMIWLLLSGLAFAQAEGEEAQADAQAERQTEQQAVPQPILRTQLDKNGAAPGERIELQIAVLVPTWQLAPPAFPELDSPSLIVRLPSESSYPVTERIDGEQWSGVAKTYQLYPMVAGRFDFPPESVTVTYAHPETSERIVVQLWTDEIAFEGIVPAGAEDLHPFTAAEALTLEQTIEGEPLELEPGGAIKRTVTAKVQGAAAIFLPPLIQPLEVENLAVYVDEPEVSDSTRDGKTLGERVERATYVATAGVTVDVRAISLRWWNLGTGAIETAQVDGFNIRATASPLDAIKHLTWRLVGGWLLTGAMLIGLLIMVFVRLRPQLDAWWCQRRATYLASETYAYSQVQAAIRAQNLGETLCGIDRWSDRLPGVSGDQLARVADVLTGLGAEFYRGERVPPSDRQWSEVSRALVAARSQSLAAARAGRKAGALPPMNP